MISKAAMTEEELSKYYDAYGEFENLPFDMEIMMYRLLDTMTTRQIEDVLDQIDAEGLQEREWKILERKHDRQFGGMYATEETEY